MTDAYDDAVKYFVENPDLQVKEWTRAGEIDLSGKGVERDNVRQLFKTLGLPQYNSCGCVTQIKMQPDFNKYDPDNGDFELEMDMLHQMIVNDPEVPDRSPALHPYSEKELNVIAGYQRIADLIYRKHHGN